MLVNGKEEEEEEETDAVTKSEFFSNLFLDSGAYSGVRLFCELIGSIIGPDKVDSLFIVPARMLFGENPNINILCSSFILYRVVHGIS